MKPPVIETPTYDSLENFGHHMRLVGLERWIYVSDSNVTELYGSALLKQGGSGWLCFPAGESSKSLAQAGKLYEELGGHAEIDRHTALVAVGGGVVGDLTGFVAATYLRGLPFVQVPTTVVAMVDSALGGKVGIDVPWGKNLVGSFWPARLIFTDPAVLLTLPAVEWSTGMAEAIKHAILDGEEHFLWLERQAPEELRLDELQARTLVAGSGLVKMRHVLEDPYEQGIRAHLNLGHTLGHALETAQGYGGLSHGQAVGIGLIAALRLSRQLGLLQEDFEDRLERLLRKWRLPTRVPAGIAWDEVEAALLRDKKNRDGQLRFVVVRGLGQIHAQAGIPMEAVRKVFDGLCESSS